MNTPKGASYITKDINKSPVKFENSRIWMFDFKAQEWVEHDKNTNWKNEKERFDHFVKIGYFVPV